MATRKKIISFTVALYFILGGLTHAPVIAEENAPRNYVVVKTGVYNPTGDMDNFDAGLNLEGAFGRYFHKNFALEGGIGIFATEAEFRGTSATLGTYIEKDDVTVVPLTVTAKGILPLDKFELFAGAGLGFYLASFSGELSSSTAGNITVDDSDGVLGFHFTAGGAYNFSDRFFFGIDGKYLFTSEATYEGAALGQALTLKGDLNGYTVNGFFGYRF